MLKHKIENYLFQALEKTSHGSINLTLPSGKTRKFSGGKPGPEANLTIFDLKILSQIAFKGDIGLAESYRDGLWDSKDLTELFMFALTNEDALKKYIHGGWFSRFLSKITYFFNKNTIKGSKKNIHSHYDIGNNFYELWLDPSMTYSSGLFLNKSNTLVESQRNKYDRIIQKLKPNASILEIGCGWGGFAERALEKGQYDIKGLTISEEQYKYANKRLAGKANIALEDYRIQTGKYDNIVSIEMFEAVGEKYWSTYFEKVKSLLAPEGRFVIQTITIDEDYFDAYSKGADAIRTFIFPGGMLPSPTKLRYYANKYGLDIVDEFSFGKDYANTLSMWKDNFEANINKIYSLGLDEKFTRMWRFYLTYCCAGFLSERTNVMQLEMIHQK